MQIEYDVIVDLTKNQLRLVYVLYDMNVSLFCFVL